MSPWRVAVELAVAQPPTTSTKKRRSRKKRPSKSHAKRKAATSGGRRSATFPRVPQEPPKRKRNRGAGKSETACELKLESFVKEKPDVIDKLSNEYVANLRADASLVQFPEEGRPWDAARPAARGAGGRRCGPRRSGRTAIVEEYVVTRRAGRLPEDLPPGTLVRKPPELLVQLIAQAIHDSPCQALRVSHVYAALQMRYPYFMYLEKRALNSWKSSVRHALFQKWFTKLRPPSTGVQSGREKSCFWGLNYNNRPREWDMPEGPKTPVAKPPRKPDNPARSSPPLDNERRQWSATSTTDTILPDVQSWNAEDTNRPGPHTDAPAQRLMEWGGQGQCSGSVANLHQPLPPLIGPLNQCFHATQQQHPWQPYWAPWSDTELEMQQSLAAADQFMEPPVTSQQDWLPFAEPADYYSEVIDTYAQSAWYNLGATEEVCCSDASFDDPLAPVPVLCSPRFCMDAPIPREEAVDHAGTAATVSRGTDARSPWGYDLLPHWAPCEVSHPDVGDHCPRPKSV